MLGHPIRSSGVPVQTKVIPNVLLDGKPRPVHHLPVALQLPSTCLPVISSRIYYKGTPWQQKQGKQVVFRADAAFAKPEIYQALEERGVKYAIRPPANDCLQRDIAELLTRQRSPSWTADGARDGRNEREDSNRAGWRYDRWWPGCEKGNPGYTGCCAERQKGNPG